MYVVVGLGNPGEQYENTRHNVGFLALDAIAKEYNFPEFTLSKKHSSLVSEGMITETKVILAKPQTFMNSSGKAVQSLMKTKPTLIVIHDDIDIPLGEIKISENRGSAGHKGVDSIVQSLGTKEFTRIRIGILPQTGKPQDVETFVIKKFSKEESQVIKNATATTITSLKEIISK